MYVIKIVDDQEGLIEAACEFSALAHWTNLLERGEIYFKVWGGGGGLKPNQFGWGDYKYWLHPDVKFPKRKLRSAEVATPAGKS